MWIDQRGSELLPRAECLRLLALSAAAGDIGRLAVSTDTAPIVLPVNFGFLHGDVVVRVGEGAMWRSVLGRLVAFEVDGTTAETRLHLADEHTLAWSVLVRGLATPLTGGGHLDRRALPRPLVPAPGDQLLVVRPDVVSGRRFALGGDDEVPRPPAASLGPPRQVAGSSGR